MFKRRTNIIINNAKQGRTTDQKYKNIFDFLKFSDFLVLPQEPIVYRYKQLKNNYSMPEFIDPPRDPNPLVLKQIKKKISYNNDVSIKVSAAIVKCMELISSGYINYSTDGPVTLNTETISLILKCFGHQCINVDKYLNNESDEVCVIQTNILDKTIVQFKLDDDICNLFNLNMSNQMFKDINYLANYYISEQHKYKKKNKNQKKVAIQDIKNKYNSVQMKNLLKLYEMHNYPDKNIEFEEIHIVYKMSKRIEYKIELVNANKMPLGLFNYIKTHSVQNQNEVKKMIEYMLTNYDTDDELNKFAYNESDGIQYCLNVLKNVLSLHIECCKLQKLLSFINILKKYKSSVVVRKGIIYYHIVKRGFLQFKDEFKYVDQYLHLNDNNEFDITCKKDEECIINNTIFTIPQATIFHSDHLTYSDAVVLTFLYKYITNTALSHSAMRNICDSFELVMNIIMRNDTFDRCKSFLKKTIDKLEKLNIITKHKDCTNQKI